MVSNFSKFVTACLITCVVGHMEMKSPAPRNSQYNKGYGSVDYSMNSPLGAFPCKGFAAGPSVATFQAGSSIPVELLGSASHNGGHCQFSLSYDGGKTFVAIKTIMGNCMLDSLNYSVQIPDSAPSSDKVVFSWSWVNKTGNREFYMNCADISIKGTANGKITGPKMVVANLPGYPTIPEFTNGGPDGSDLFTKAETITVGNGGNAGPASPVTPPAAELPAKVELKSEAEPKVDTQPNQLPNNDQKPKVDYSPNQLPNNDQKPKVDYSPNQMNDPNSSKPKTDYSNTDYSNVDFSNVDYSNVKF